MKNNYNPVLRMSVNCWILDLPKIISSVAPFNNKGLIEVSQFLKLCK